MSDYAGEVGEESNENEMPVGETSQANKDDFKNYIDLESGGMICEFWPIVVNHLFFRNLNLVFILL